MFSTFSFQNYHNTLHLKHQAIPILSLFAVTVYTTLPIFRKLLSFAVSDKL